MAAPHYYQRVQEEIERKELQQDLWLRAYAQAGGNDKKAISFYITLRVEQLYRENTPFFQRVLDSIKRAYSLHTKRGWGLCGATVLALAFFLWLALQPSLRRQGQEKSQALCAKLVEADLPGKNQQVMFEKLGNPEQAKTSVNSLIYIYNPSSKLCLHRSQYEIRVFVGGQTATTITGIQKPLAMERP